MLHNADFPGIDAAPPGRLARGMALTLASALGFALPQALWVRLFPQAVPWLPRWFHRGLLRALDVRVSVVGSPARASSVLFVANHISWIDIPVLGSQLLGAFVAKAEVAQWGMAGRLADLQRTLYVERSRRQSSGQQRDDIAERLAAGHNIFLFPEGTSSCGRQVLPFKSTLFAITDGLANQDALIQPVTLAYTTLNHMPMRRDTRYDLAWIGDMELLPHARAVMQMGPVGVQIRYHAPVRRADFANRKTLALYCQQAVAAGLVAARRDPFALGDVLP